MYTRTYTTVIRIPLGQVIWKSVCDVIWWFETDIVIAEGKEVNGLYHGGCYFWGRFHQHFMRADPYIVN